MKKLAQGFNTAAQDSNSGSRSRESDALSLSHCTLQGSLRSTTENHEIRFVMVTYCHLWTYFLQDLTVNFLLIALLLSSVILLF